MTHSSKDKKDILTHFLYGGGVSKIFHTAKRIEKIIYQQDIILHFENSFIEKYGKDLDKLRYGLTKEKRLNLWISATKRTHPLEYVNLGDVIGVTELWYPRQEEDFYVAELRELQKEDNYIQFIKDYDAELENCVYLKLILKQDAFERLATKQLQKFQQSINDLRSKYYDTTTD